MNDKYGGKYSEMKYIHMDVKDMKEFKDGSFESVIDKGTLDTLLCGDCSVPYSEAMLQEINRVLCPNGVYICISYGLPETRKPLIEKMIGGEVKVAKVLKPYVTATSVVDKEAGGDKKSYHYMFIAQKSSK